MLVYQRVTSFYRAELYDRSFTQIAVSLLIEDGFRRRSSTPLACAFLFPLPPGQLSLGTGLGLFSGSSDINPRLTVESSDMNLLGLDKRQDHAEWLFNSRI